MCKWFCDLSSVLSSPCLCCYQAFSIVCCSVLVEQHSLPRVLSLGYPSLAPFYKQDFKSNANFSKKTLQYRCLNHLLHSSSLHHINYFIFFMTLKLNNNFLWFIALLFHNLISLRAHLLSFSFQSYNHNPSNGTVDTKWNICWMNYDLPYLSTVKSRMYKEHFSLVFLL